MTQREDVDRRALLRSAVAAMGMACFGRIDAFSRAGGSDLSLDRLTPSALEVIAAVVDTLIPRTATPGAIDVGVVAFIRFVLDHGLPERAQQVFYEGLQAMVQNARLAMPGGFLRAGRSRRETYLQAQEQLLESPQTSLQDRQVGAFLQIVKRLTIIGFFTSEAGARNELNVALYPGPFVGSEPVTMQTRVFYEDSFGVPLERPPGYLNVRR